MPVFRCNPTSGPRPPSMAGVWRTLRAVGVLVALAGPLAGVRAQEPLADDPSPHSELTLRVPVSHVSPGQTVTVALRLVLDDGWHTYWQNGGDAGLPLNVAWTLPDGVSAGPVRFPVPGLMPEPPLMSYGYKHEVTFLADLRFARELPVGHPLEIAAAADWLACADLCLPAAAQLTLALPVELAMAVADPEIAGELARARARMPIDGRAWRTEAALRDSVLQVAIVVPSEARAAMRAPYWFVDSLPVVEHAAAQRSVWDGDTLRLAILRSPFADGAPSLMRGVLVADASSDSSDGWLLEIPLPRDAPLALAPEAAAQLASRDAQSVGGLVGDRAAAVALLGGADSLASSGALGLVAAVLFAFVGGLLLNLMPCVFPVLSVKVLGFLEQGGGDRAAGRRHGLAFAGGVLGTFWLLAGVLLAVRAGGESLGWGFQLQSPPVVAALAVLIFALALNLSGVFEIGLSLTRLGGVGQGRGLADSFLTGALAVVVAAPCTAPFMGAALGFALVQPPLQSMLVFTALGAGLALPYVVLTRMPSLLRRLPRPGPWLETVKQALAFPLFLTVVWLLWVFGQQTDLNALALLLVALIVFGFGAWLWGRAAHAGRRSGYALALASMTGALVLALSTSRVGAGSDEETESALAWETFSPERVVALRAEGRPVFVDFTAAWCLSCQVNERVALTSASAREAFADRNVALLKADWTSRDPEIAQVLASFGRSGVPLYVMYASEAAAAPELLPAVLTPGMVVDAIRRAQP
jgi:thiol:disulfide interchange protein/DsbC/DsbD-like thiol-disulfide interchange protein